MSKIKVLQVVGQLMIGGQETMVMNFCRYSDKNKIDFDFMVYGDEIGDFEEEANAMGGKVIHAPALKEVGYQKFTKNIKDILEKNGPYAAIHCHTSLNSGVVLKYAKKNNIPVRITHSHTTRPGKKVTPLFSLYSYFMRKIIIRYSTHLIACGKDAGNYLFGEEIFSREGSIIKNGIVLEHFKKNDFIRAKVRTELCLEDDFVVGHVGRFGEEKNHLFLLNIFKKVVKKEPNSILLLVGTGPLQPTIKKEARLLEIEDKVIFTGQRNDIQEVLQAMDVFVFPSIYEGLPVSVVEAQASGLPCILSANITSEIRITNLADFLSLDESAEEWAKTIINKKMHSRQNLSEDIQKSGYDIRDVCKKLQIMYMGEKIIEIK